MDVLEPCLYIFTGTNSPVCRTTQNIPRRRKRPAYMFLTYTLTYHIVLFWCVFPGNVHHGNHRVMFVKVHPHVTQFASCYWRSVVTLWCGGTQLFAWPQKHLSNDRISSSRCNWWGSAMYNSTKDVYLAKHNKQICNQETLMNLV